MNSSFSLRRFGVIRRISSAALVGVLRGVERGELVAEGQRVAVLLDDGADVVALERHRPREERSGHRVAAREPLVVAVDRDRLVEAGHEHDAALRPCHTGPCARTHS